MRKNPKYSFFFHYNKPASVQARSNRLSVHYRKVCHVVESIDCRVPVKTKNRNSQPRCVMTGKAKDLTIVNGIAIIT